MTNILGWIFKSWPLIKGKTAELTHHFSAVQWVSSYSAQHPSFFLPHNGLCMNQAHRLNDERKTQHIPVFSISYQIEISQSYGHDAQFSTTKKPNVSKHWCHTRSIMQLNILKLWEIWLLVVNNKLWCNTHWFALWSSFCFCRLLSTYFRTLLSGTHSSQLKNEKHQEIKQEAKLNRWIITANADFSIWFNWKKPTHFLFQPL